MERQQQDSPPKMTWYLQLIQPAQVVQLVEVGKSIFTIATWFAVVEGHQPSWTRRDRRSTIRAIKKLPSGGYAGVFMFLIKWWRSTAKVADPLLMYYSLHRWKQVKSEFLWQAWKGLEMPWLLTTSGAVGQWWSEPCAVCLENYTDFFMVATRDETLKFIVRPYAGSVAPGFLLV